jgi:hypothetical protein
VIAVTARQIGAPLRALHQQASWTSRSLSVNNPVRGTTKEDEMKTTLLNLTFAAATIIGMASTGAVAQSAEPSFKGDPDVYKVIFEDANFRVIEAVRKKGVHDKAHGHPVASIVYSVTDCKTKQYAADGKTTEGETKAGSARAVPVIASHSAENIGNADCKQVFVEKK